LGVAEGFWRSKSKFTKLTKNKNIKNICKICGRGSFGFLTNKSKYKPTSNGFPFLIKQQEFTNIYNLYGRKRFLLPITYISTNLVYPFTLRIAAIKND